MNDEQISARIEELEAEERSLRSDEQAAANHDDSAKVAADAERLAAIKVELDQLWDLSHQRKALRDSGGNPDDAELRDSGTVENYLG